VIVLSLITDVSARATRGVGNNIVALSRITVTPKSLNHAASYSALPFCAEVYTTVLPKGRRSINPITKVSIPPARGPKSLVTKSM
jgi:hypothetical protein